MIFLHDWAKRHGVGDAALSELQGIMSGVITDPENPRVNGSEAKIQNEVRLEGGKKGVRLFRNNVGACKDETGRVIRYGLANESKEMNKRVKSADLIGIRPILITPDYVGATIGQFVAREVKASGWRYKGNEHEVAQLAFLNLVVSLGGDACFAADVGTL